MKKYKFVTIATFFAFAVIAFAFSGNYSEAQTKTSANKNAQILAVVAGYKSWRQITKQEPQIELVKSPSSTEPTFIFDSMAMGWSSVSSIRLIDSGSVSTSGGTTKIGMSGDRLPPKREKEPDNPHEKGVSTYARYYGNELAQDEIFKAQPKFPVGAMLVREKLLRIDDTAPQLVTVMLKREAGFNKKNGDWEYLVVDGSLAKVIKREKKGSCATCHANASQTDFVYKTYLK